MNRIHGIIKHYTYPRKLPKSILVIVAIPRSGSTWLLDAIRCHPKINYEPTTTVYSTLGLSGGRYPNDLVNIPVVGKKFENSKFRWVNIPDFNILDGVDLNSDQLRYQSFSIEKIHPEFFNYNLHSFLNNIQLVESKGTQVKFVYLVREPKEAIMSWLNYQRRNPNWNQNRDRELLVNYYDKNLKNILELAERRKGVLLDFSSMVNNMESVLKDIYYSMWTDQSKTDIKNYETIIQASLEATSRSKRLKSGTPFLGNKLGPTKANAHELNSFFDRHKAGIKQCYMSYNSLLQLMKNV